jgi:hypothetical protein
LVSQSMRLQMGLPSIRWKLGVALPTFGRAGGVVYTHTDVLGWLEWGLRLAVSAALGGGSDESRDPEEMSFKRRPNAPNEAGTDGTNTPKRVSRARDGAGAATKAPTA